jgi:TM2 domain-containing membrane protein YozV
VSNLDLPGQPEPAPAAPDRGFVTYPVEPADADILARPPQDPTPGYFEANPAQALVPAQPTTLRAVKRAERQARRQTRFTPTPDAPYGRDAATGEPLSDKYRVVAAGLQILLGPIGAGRFYIGHKTIGFLSMAALVTSIVVTAYWGWWVSFVALGLWCVADFILILSGHVRDGEGRKLR